LFGWRRPPQRPLLAAVRHRSRPRHRRRQRTQPPPDTPSMSRRLRKNHTPSSNAPDAFPRPFSLTCRSRRGEPNSLRGERPGLARAPHARGREFDGLAPLRGRCGRESKRLTDFSAQTHDRAAWTHDRLAWTHDRVAWSHDRVAWSHDRVAWSHDQVAWTHGPVAWTHGQVAWTHGPVVWTHGPVVWTHGPVAPTCGVSRGLETAASDARTSNARTNNE